MNTFDLVVTDVIYRNRTIHNIPETCPNCGASFREKGSLKASELMPVDNHYQLYPQQEQDPVEVDYTACRAGDLQYGADLGTVCWNCSKCGYELATNVEHQDEDGNKSELFKAVFCEPNEDGTMPEPPK